MSGAFLDQQAVHLLAFWTGLVRDELHAEDLARVLANLIQRLGNLHAATLATATRMDLSLHDPHRAAELFWRLLTASSTEKTGLPRGTATPNFRRISLPWYS